MSVASFTPLRIKAHCANCGPDRWATVFGHHIKRDVDGPVWWHGDYRILQCAGCENVFFQLDSVFSEDESYFINEAGEEDYELDHKIVHYPIIESGREKPEWLWRLGGVDDSLSELVEAIYTALQHNLNVLAAIGVRTAFDRATELLGVPEELTFMRKLGELRAMGKIGDEELKTLSVLIDAGSAAAHRGWKPSSKELDTMMTVLETFLYRAFLLQREIDQLRTKVPRRS